jgi:tRNA-dihydrouridine synthase
MAEECGVDALTGHPRSAGQGFRGHSDWSVIAAVKDILTIPVIGNGDITKPADALQMLNQTGCDGVMIGRAAIGNPFIFNDIQSLLEGMPEPERSLAQHFTVMKRYLKDSVTYLGEHRACLMMRSRLGWFVKGLHGSSQFRKSISCVSTLAEAMSAIEKYEDLLMKAGIQGRL